MKKFLTIFLFFVSFVLADSVSDLCYEEPTFSGTVCVDSGLVNGGLNCTQTTVIKNLSNDNLTNVQIVLDVSGYSANVLSDCGIDGESKKNDQCKELNAYDFGPMGILNDAVVYDPMTDFNGHDNHSIYIYSLVSGSLFSDNTLYTTYTKNGKTYTGVILPCNEVENNLSEVAPVCNVYTNVLQTRNDNSKITMSDDGQTGYIENTSNYHLNTSYVYRDDYGHGLICDTNGNYQKDTEEFMAEETGNYGASLDVNYTFNVESADVSSSPASSWASDETIDEENEELSSYQYDTITQDYHHYNFSLTYDGDKKINTFDQILNTVTFKNNTDHDVDIGYFKTGSYSTTNIIFDSVPKNIRIYELNTTGSNELNISGFSASQSIRIHNLGLNSSHKVNLTISAPKVVIDNLLSTNDDNTITIYANEIDINTVKFAQNSKLVIYPYTTGTNVVFRSDSITASSSSTMLVSSGDYYTNKFSIPGSSDVSSIRAIDSNQTINFYINGDFKPGNNPGINSLGNGGNFGDLPPENFRLYINGDLDGGDGGDDTGTTFNALVYVEKSTSLGTSTYLRGALSSGDSIVIDNNSKFYWDSDVGTSDFGMCATNYQNITGNFDAWDVNKSIDDRNITTEIVNKSFDLTLASLNNEDNAVEQKNVGNIEVAIFDMDSDNQISNTVYFDTNTSAEVNKTFNVNIASRNAKVGFKLCSDYNATTKTHILYDYSKCSGNIVNCDDEGLHFRECFSTDNFAIRPDRYKIISMNQKLISAKDVNLTVQALDYNGNLINDFNFTNAPVEINVTDAIGCKTGNFVPNTTATVNFTNGEANLTFNYKDVGDLNVSIQEYKNGNEYASADEGTESDDKLLISESNSTVKRFYPDHFSINGTKYSNFNNSNFTYISSDLNMSSVLDLNITAENEENSTTQNYNENCYAKNFDVNISHSVPNELNETTLILYKDEKGNEHNVTLNSDMNLTNLPKSYFSTDHNGSAEVKIYINFEKNYTKPVNEFNFTINDINISDYNVTSSSTLNQNATFRYGRIKVSNAAAYSNDINTTFEYQYWNSNEGWVKNVDHNSSEFGDFNHTINSDISPFVNVSNTASINNATQKVIFHTSHALPYSVKVHLQINSWLWYHPLAKKGYIDPSSKNTDCLTHPCLKLDFLKESAGWGGVKAINNSAFNESNRTSDINASNSDVNVSKSQVKKINW